jgi:hypothetical protein
MYSAFGGIKRLLAMMESARSLPYKLHGLNGPLPISGLENDHEQTVTFVREEFEAELKSGARVFHCNTCDTNWPSSREDIAKIRKQLSKISG